MDLVLFTFAKGLAFGGVVYLYNWRLKGKNGLSLTIGLRYSSGAVGRGVYGAETASYCIYYMEVNPRPQSLCDRMRALC